MSKESIMDAIDATAASIRNVQRATRHRSDWLFVRLETLDAWAQEQGIVLTEPGALDKATRLFFQKGEEAKVVAGIDGTNASLLAIWCREGEPTYDPPWDGMPPWMRDASDKIVTVDAETEEGPKGSEDPMGFAGLFAFGATGGGQAPEEGPKGAFANPSTPPSGVTGSDGEIRLPFSTPSFEPKQKAK